MRFYRFFPDNSFGGCVGCWKKRVGSKRGHIVGGWKKMGKLHQREKHFSQPETCLRSRILVFLLRVFPTNTGAAAFVHRCQTAPLINHAEWTTRHLHHRRCLVDSCYASISTSPSFRFYDRKVFPLLGELLRRHPFHQQKKAQIWVIKASWMDLIRNYGREDIKRTFRVSNANWIREEQHFCGSWTDGFST